MPTKYTLLHQFYRLGQNCYYCGAPFGGASRLAKTVDHKQPLSRGGSNRPSNLVACCHDCNHTKANMTEAEFVEWRRRGKPNRVAYLREIGLIQPPRPTVRTPDFDSGNRGSNPREAAT